MWFKNALFVLIVLTSFAVHPTQLVAQGPAPTGLTREVVVARVAPVPRESQPTHWATGMIVGASLAMLLPFAALIATASGDRGDNGLALAVGLMLLLPLSAIGGLIGSFFPKR